MSSQTCSVAALVCSASRVLPNLRSYYVLDAYAAAILAKRNTGRHVKHYGVRMIYLCSRRSVDYANSKMLLHLKLTFCSKSMIVHGRGKETTLKKVSRSLW